jgi:hypothetical protein
MHGETVKKENKGKLFIVRLAQTKLQNADIS